MNTPSAPTVMSIDPIRGRAIAAALAEAASRRPPNLPDSSLIESCRTPLGDAARAALDRATLAVDRRRDAVFDAAGLLADAARDHVERVVTADEDFSRASEAVDIP